MSFELRREAAHEGCLSTWHSRLVPHQVGLNGGTLDVLATDGADPLLGAPQPTLFGYVVMRVGVEILDRMMRIKDIPLNVGSFMRMRFELLLFVLNEFSHVELV